MRRELETWAKYNAGSSWTKKTTKVCEGWAKSFADFMEKRCGISKVEEITPEHINIYKQEIISRLSLASHKTYRWRTCSFFNWCISQNLIISSPATHWPVVERPRIQPPVLSISQVETVLKSIDTSTFGGIQKRAIVEIFYATGIRIDELNNLNITDLDIENKKLNIRSGKGLKDRIVPIHAKAMVWIELYVKDVRQNLIEPGNPSLFVRVAGKRMSSNYLYKKMFREISKTVGFYVRPHLLRHSCATHLMEANVPLVYIKELLGHTYLKSTERYLRVTLVERKKIFDQTHPREKWSVKE